ncbi:MAG: hypothetical protein H7Z41_17935 [Cytophagales bacterium]|nr:hypothetical protein [Armatimonadota bacterium]
MAGSGSASPLAGRRVATLTLEPGRSGALDFTVDAANRVRGTLTVSSRAAISRQAYRFNIGTYQIPGIVDPQTGAFALTGTIPGSGLFTVSGILPASGSGGGYTLTAGGQSYSGIFGAAAPSPIPSPTPTPGVTPAPAAAA